MKTLYISFLVIALTLSSCTKDNDLPITPNLPSKVEIPFLLESISVNGTTPYKKYYYDSKNRLSKWETFDQAESVEYQAVYTYDFDDKIQSISLKYVMTNVGGIAEIYYGNDNRVSRITCSGRLKYNYTFSYLPMQTVVDLYDRYADSRVKCGTITYTKDSIGNIVEENFKFFSNPAKSYIRKFSNYDNKKLVRDGYHNTTDLASSFFLPNFIFSKHNYGTETFEYIYSKPVTNQSTFQFDVTKSCLPSDYPTGEVASMAGATNSVQLSFKWIKGQG